MAAAENDGARVLFNSYVFIFAFLPVAWGVHAALSRSGRHTAALSWLGLASLFFYGWWDPRYLPLLLGSVLFNHAVATWLHRYPRRAILAAGVGANLGLLAFCKYAGFLSDLIPGLEIPSAPEEIPLAISFFTFQQIAYLVDVFRTRQADRNILRYGVFVTFFPQLIAGPIVHHHEMMPQFRPGSSVEPISQRLAVGGTMFTLGLAKKVLIADTFAELATPVFDFAGAGATPQLGLAWVGVLAYTLQIYFDFSGYSDMAIGLARLFGVRLPANFASPYRSRTITDFWRRWHMTLSRFLRDYLYIPLGGNRKGPARRYVNLMLTMLLGGLWHGAGWTFVAWGGLHGAYLVIHHAWERFRSRPLPWPVAQAITLGAVMFAWIFFRAADFDTAARMIAGLGGTGDGALLEIAELENFALIVAAFAIACCAPNSQTWLRGYRPILEEPAGATPARGGWRPTPVHAMLVAALFIFSVMRITRYSEFIYFQF